jgi:nucleoside-diphosphate-sugar epimerase
VNWRQEPVFVTGATGFIGGRVCERLVMAGAREVRALVHNTQHVSRVARLPVALLPGDLLDRGSLRRALKDARVVIHCGLGSAQGIWRGTQNLLEVAAATRVERFIHISTLSVYGLRPSPGCEKEEAPLKPTGEPYCDNKARAERVVAHFLRRGVPSAIIRPGVVYGPYSFWSTRLIGALREGRVAFIDGGKGACNITHVDNLVDAVFLAIENERAVGERFNITDGQAFTWGDFIRAHVLMMDPQPVVPCISSEEILAHHRSQAGLWASSLRAARRVFFGVEFRKMLRQIPICDRILGAIWGRLQAMDPEEKEMWKERLRGKQSTFGASAAGRESRYIPDLTTWANESHQVHFSIQKARKTLGYSPRVPFAEGIKLVEAWLRFANYL